METENNNETKSKIVETYAEDMAQAIEGGDGGLIKKLIHGEEEKELEKINLSPESRKNKLLMFFGVVFFFIALILFIYFLILHKTPSVSIEKQFIPIIFNDKTSFLNIQNKKSEEIINGILNEIEKGDLRENGVWGIYLTLKEKIIGLREFLYLTGSNLSINNQDFIEDNFLLGIVKTREPSFSGTNKNFFLLLKTRTLTDIFNKMTSWEKKMFYDLHRFFDIPLSHETNYLLTKDFEDGIIYNKNARILFDKDKKIVILYVYVDDDSVIVANSSDAIREIVNRLASSRIKK